MQSRIFICLVMLAGAASVGAAERNAARPEPVKGIVVERSAEPATAEGTAAAPVAPAQELSVGWSVLASGGGRWTSGTFLVSGTMGQTAAGTIASAENVVHAGFWQNFEYTACCENRGNVDHLFTNGNPIAITDLTYLIAMLFRGGADAPCMEEADLTVDGKVNIADVTFLIALLFRGGPVPAPC